MQKNSPALRALRWSADDLDPRYPDVGTSAKRELRRVKRLLEKEAPEGRPADPYAAEVKRKAKS